MKSQGLTTAPTQEQFDTPVSVETEAVVETTQETAVTKKVVAKKATPKVKKAVAETDKETTVTKKVAVKKAAPKVKKAVVKKAAPEVEETVAETDKETTVTKKVAVKKAAPEVEEIAVSEDVVAEAVPEVVTPDAEATEPVAPVENPYAEKTQLELIEILSTMLEERSVQNLREDMEAVKIAFYKAGRVKLEAEHTEFIASGGVAEDFKPTENSSDPKFKALLIQYREKRDAFILNAEQAKDKAYAEKRQIIEELKELITGNETIGKTFNAFRDLQQRWKDAGIVPQEKIKDLWDTYHHHVEIFYNYIKINKELRDLDLKKNYEAKTILAEESEALTLDPSATSAFNKLQKLHDQWREIGPVIAEFKDVLWDRFKIASTQINKRHQDYFEGIKGEQMQNLALKVELCEKVEELAVGEPTTHKEWTAASEQIIEVQKLWKTIGFAPKKENTKIYERFRSACDKFFEAKRSFYKVIKSEIDDNLQAKLDLCVQAEALQESEDWKATADALIALQKKWKEIGATSRKHSEQVWKRFRSASDRFFSRKTEHFGSQDSQYAENLTRKQQMLEDMRKVLHEKLDVTFDTLKEYQRKWAEIGFVPIKKKDTIYAEYRKVVDGLFELLRGEDRERHVRNFRDKVSKIKEGGTRRLGQERERLYNKIRQIESDIQIWENNIGFFSKSKNSEALMKEVQNKIGRAKAQITTMIEQVKVIDNPALAEVKTKIETKAKAETVDEVTTAPEVEVLPTSEVETKIETKATAEVEVETKETETEPKSEADITPEVEPDTKEIEAEAKTTAKKK